MTKKHSKDVNVDDDDNDNGGMMLPEWENEEARKQGANGRV